VTPTGLLSCTKPLMGHDRAAGRASPIEAHVNIDDLVALHLRLECKEITAKGVYPRESVLDTAMGGTTIIVLHTITERRRWCQIVGV
jgi:hypothetical protein